MLSFENRYVKELTELASEIVIRDQYGFSPDGWPSVERFEQEAYSLGYIKLGSGHFSQAWTHPEISEHAIKLGFKKEDSGAAYAAFCRQNQGMAGIPTIYGIKQLGCGYTVLMDKYSPCTDLCRVSVLSHIMRNTKHSINFQIISPKADEELNNTARLIGEFFRGIAAIDLHDENVMEDKEGNLIITDPVSFSLYKPRERGVTFLSTTKVKYGLSLVKQKAFALRKVSELYEALNNHQFKQEFKIRNTDWLQNSKASTSPQSQEARLLDRSGRT